MGQLWNPAAGMLVAFLWNTLITGTIFCPQVSRAWKVLSWLPAHQWAVGCACMDVISTGEGCEWGGNARSPDLCWPIGHLSF